MDSEVIIVGGGLTGSVLALLLARAGIPSTIIEPRPARETDAGPGSDPRALTLTPATRRILESIGVWRQLPADGIGRFQGMAVWDEAGHGQVRFDCHSVAEPVLGYVVEQPLLQQALDRVTDVHPGIQLERGRRVTGLEQEPDAAVISLDNGSRRRCRLLAAADGVASPTRQLAGIEYRRHDYRQRAVACLVQTARPHEGVARQRFLRRGPLAFLPLADPHRCGVVWSTTPEQARELLDLDREAFHAALAEAFGFTLGEILDSGERQDFPLGRAQAESYVSGRLALVGDAAHCIHPLAGQGANLGLLDAASLVEVAVAARSRNRDPGSQSVLRRYERWRRGENYLMMMVLEGFKVLFETPLAPARLLRNLGLNTFNSVPALKQWTMRRAMGLEGDLPAIVRRTPR